LPLVQALPGADFCIDMKEKRLIFSTNGLNRYKTRLLSSGAKLEHYLKNPVLLFGHQSYGLPIGRVEDIRIEENGDMTALPVFDENDQMALAVKDKWENNFLFAASIHYAPLSTSSDPAFLLPGQEKETVTEWDLMEISIVTVPGNGGSATGYQLDAFGTSDIPHITTIQPDMDLKKIALSLGLPESADEATVLAAIKKLNSDNSNLLSAKVDNVLAIGRQKGIVTPENEADFQKLAASDLPTLEKIFGGAPDLIAEDVVTKKDEKPEAPKGTLLTGMLNAGGVKSAKTVSDGREDWSFDDWGKKDQKGLLAMKQKDPERYQELAAAKLAATV